MIKRIICEDWKYFEVYVGNKFTSMTFLYKIIANGSVSNFLMKDMT